MQYVLLLYPCLTLCSTHTPYNKVSVYISKIFLPVKIKIFIFISSIVGLVSQVGRNIVLLLVLVIISCELLSLSGSVWCSSSCTRPERTPRVHWIEDWVGLKGGGGCWKFGVESNTLHLPEIEPRLLGFSSLSPVTVLSELSLHTLWLLQN